MQWFLLLMACSGPADTGAPAPDDTSTPSDDTPAPDDTPVPDDTAPPDDTAACDGFDCGLAGEGMARDAADAVLLGENAEDHAGLVVAPAGDVNLDGHADLLVSAHGQSDYGGGAYLVHGPVTGTVSLGEADLILRGPGDYIYMGLGLAAVGDTTGDGVPDVLVGAPGAYREAGVAVLYDGAQTGEPSWYAASTARYRSVYDEDAVGRSLAGPGDTDGDGLADLLICAPQPLTGQRGKAHLVPGGLTGEVALESMPRIVGEDYLTVVEVSAADIDGDGVGDAVIRAWKGVAIVFLPITGEVSIEDADLYVEGGGTELGAGAALGDLDGDGRPDLGLGEPEDAGETGVVRLFTGLSAGRLTAADATVVVPGLAPDDQFGDRVSDAGDVDGDGRADVIVTAPHGGPDDVGAAYLLGKATIALGDIEYPSISAAGVGDVDGDGYDDVLVGSPTDDTAALFAGAAYLFLGGEGP